MIKLYILLSVSKYYKDEKLWELQYVKHQAWSSVGKTSLVMIVEVRRLKVKIYSGLSDLVCTVPQFWCYWPLQKSPLCLTCHWSFPVSCKMHQIFQKYNSHCRKKLRGYQSLLSTTQQTRPNQVSVIFRIS